MFSYNALAIIVIVWNVLTVDALWVEIKNSKCEGVERNGLKACAGCYRKVPKSDSNEESKKLCFCQFGSNCHFGHPKTCGFLDMC
uniref:Uncharacterized protein n=1 Tax=Romanomermis culicivorax TaxID=13658 RepID=A0A915JU69_ROMCU